ncbi:MAG: GIY-YIG nuclease family protein [Candidatus Saccharicenans sp.]|jgi:hypothetical protein|nr:GIY-YIG nuclease family protein [Candidatus Saccharicenans sp.]MDH7574246.1 GIY-YIG nuclease family protein [Candidatus Saccharicenans sp.]
MKMKEVHKSKLGFSLKIFMPQGEPDGIKIIEKSNWTGQGISFPRALFAEARKREELKKTGVYILMGPGEKDSFPRIYVGEGDPVLPRLDQHMRNKDFWTHAIVYISKDLNLNKAHVQYLEARLISLAADAKRCVLDNGNIPQLPTLSEADTVDVETFLSEMLTCLPVLGINFFEKPKPHVKNVIKLFIKSKGITAEGYESAEGFVVCANSMAVKEEVPSLSRYARYIRKALIDSGVFVDKGKYYQLSQDYLFSSPSAAASIVLGNESNGRTEWKDASGRTLKEIQTELTKANNI